MPMLNLYTIEKEDDSATYKGRVSYDLGETFASFRDKLNILKMFDFPFDFWDLDAKTQMSSIFEKINKIEEFDNEVIVIKRGC